VNQLVGTGALVRLIVRRDRVRVGVWMTAIVVMVVSSAAGVKGIYPTAEDLRTAAATIEGNAAAIAFNGPVQGLETLGGRIAFEAGTIGLVLVGLMSLFMVGRLTRAEEESGRLELVRATVVGRHAPMAAALVVVTAMNVVVGAVVTVGILSQDVPLTGSVVFGTSFIAVGVVFAAVAAVTAQVTENTRVASGLAGAAVGLAFALRAVGDIGDGTLSWLSPIGWGQKTRPFAGEQWWPLAVPVVFAVACVALAVVFASHRDLGAGLLPARKGPPVARPSLGHPLGLAFRLQRGALIAWSAGVFILGVVYGSVGDDIEEFVADNEALRDVLARSGANLTDSFFGTSLLVLALIGSGFALQAVHRLRSEETGLRAEPILATPISRARWMASHLAVAFVGSIVVLAAGGLGVGLSYGLITGDLGELPPLLGDALAYTSAVSLLVGLAIALFGFVPRTMAAVWAVLALSLVVGFFGESLDLPEWVSALSPFEHTPLVPAAELTTYPLLIMGAIAAALTCIGVVGLRRRDIG